MENTIVKFKLEGPLFEDGIPLLEVVTTLQEFHSIVDRAYTARFNIPKLNKKDREQYRIIARQFQRGSFEADLLFTIASGAQLLFPNLQQFGSKELWEIVKAAFTFLKTLVTARNNGIEPTVNIEGHGNTVIVMKNNVINLDKIVYKAADMSEPHYKKLTSVIEKGKINSIVGVDSRGEGISLTENEKKLFNPKTTVEKDVVAVRCSIFRFDKEANTGKLRIPEGESVPPGEYNFKPLSKQDYKKFIISMMNPMVTLNVLKEIETHTSGAKRISSLLVVSFENLQQDLLFSI